MEQISKDHVLAAVVRTFFKYFTIGVLESRHGSPSTDHYEPKNVKQAMLNHYGQIGAVFNNEAFYSFFRMNYDASEAEPVMRDAATTCTSKQELVRLACRTEEFYDAMVSEYKRNFELLLCGRVAVGEEFAGLYTPCPSSGKMARDKAEQIINSMAAMAYKRGQEAAEPCD